MKSKLYGCKVNKYHLNQRLQYFSINPTDYSLSNYPYTIVIASCEVTDQAKKKYIKDIITHAQKGFHIFLTGCGAIERGETITEQKFFDRYPELQPYTSHITLLPESPRQNKRISQLSTISTRKPVIIQTGCDNYCSFCLTVRKRGPHKSRPAHEIINEINEFQQTGGQEIVITGINLAARGCSQSTNPQESKFSYLLQQIISETEIPRIRISSLGPEYLDDNFFETIQNTRFMPHFHLSIQSFSDKVLKDMQRNYDSNLLNRVLHDFTHCTLHHTLSLGADIITSFPGETEEDFMKTYEALSKYNITKLHAFPFSAHQKGETIPASFLDGHIDQEQKVLRNRKLIAEGNRIRTQFIQSQKGQSFQVLLEQQKNGFRQGWTENYIEVKVAGEYQKNQIITYTLS